MKKNFGKIFVASLIFGLATTGVMRADENALAIRSDSEKAFTELTSNSIDSLKTVLSENEGTSKGEKSEKFQIAEVQAPTQTTTTTTTTTPDGQTQTNTQTTTATTASKIGIKVWFELGDGTLVNPVKKKWDKKEKFYVHVQSAVPIYVSLFQNYPESRPTSRQIYPDAKYTDSFKAIQPGQTTRLPVAFEMDDDLRDEIMSMVVVRADWSGIQSGLTAQATASVTNNNGTAQVTAQVNTTGTGTMKCINERVVTKKEFSVEDAKLILSDLTDQKAEALSKAVNDEASNAKFQIIGSETVTSSQPNDVCFYMFGAGNVGQWQLTIKK